MQDHCNSHGVQNTYGNPTENFRWLFEESKDVIYICNPVGKLLDINAAGLRLLNYSSKAQLLNTDLKQSLFVDPLDCQKLEIHIQQHGSIKDFFANIQCKTGEIISVLISATAEYDKTGQISRYRGIIRDVTEQRHLQGKFLHAQRMETLGRLSGGIAHDLNNLLAALLGYAELCVLDIPEQSTAGDNIEQIILGANRAKKLVSQILDFTGKYESKFTEVCLQEILEEVVSLLSAALLPGNIDIKTNFKTTASRIMADETQMHQIMMNLVINAHYAMQETGGILELMLENKTVSARTTTDGVVLEKGAYLLLTVSDTGCGIDKSLLNQIFDPFFTTKPVGDGTGLGLAVVHEIVESHGGKITVSSKEKEGTTFKVYLPSIK